MCAVSFSDFSEKSEKTSQHAATLPLVTKDFPNKLGNMHRRVSSTLVSMLPHKAGKNRLLKF